MAVDQPDIKITVKVQHFPDRSQNNQEFFAYTIVIENKSDTSWQLISRHWEIQEAIGRVFIIDGEGVEGEKPIIAPNGKYTYDSSLEIKTTPGFMSGYYIMIDAWGKKINVPIAPFTLDVQQKRVLN